jgi:hypothetical protein
MPTSELCSNSEQQRNKEHTDSESSSTVQCERKKEKGGRFGSLFSALFKYLFNMYNIMQHGMAKGLLKKESKISETNPSWPNSE